MKVQILLTAFMFFSTLTFSQDQSKKWYESFTEFYVAQNNCNNEFKVKLLRQVDSIPCRTDSLFKTDNPKYYLFKSYDQNNNLIFIGTIHIHIKNISVLDLPNKNILASPLYQDSLHISIAAVVDKYGSVNIIGMSLCDFYSPPHEEMWENFGWDIFGTKTTIKYDQIKRMPLNR